MTSTGPGSERWIGTYLDLLAVEPRGADLEALTQLVRAHSLRIPFENVSSILRRHANPHGRVPALDLEAILESWVNRRAGGVCFEITQMFECLLIGLGYRVYPVMADSSFPGSHQALVVDLAGTRVLVDVGNSAPLFDVIPLVGVVEISRAGLGYRFRPDEHQADMRCLDRLIDGSWTPFMRYHIQPATAEAREASYQRHHTPGGSWVVDSLRIMRCQQDEAWLVRDDRLTHFTTAAKHVEQIGSRAEYVRIAADVLGMPGLPVGAAFNALARRQGSAESAA